MADLDRQGNPARDGGSTWPGSARTDISPDTTCGHRRAETGGDRYWPDRGTRWTAYCLDTAGHSHSITICIAYWNCHVYTDA